MNMRYSRSATIAMTLVLAACGSVPLNLNSLDLNKAVQTVQSAKEATYDLSEEQEIVLGQNIVSGLLGIASLLANQKVQQYVNNVGRWLTLQTERPDLPWAFAVIDDNDINAFATPGGYIVITKGLLLRMKSEAELAGVLAHEISHVLKKHHLQAIKKAAGMSVAKDILSMGIEARGSNPAMVKLASAGTELYTRGLDKEDEFEADRMGVVIAARSGYDPYGLPAVLQTLQTINPQDAGLALMFKTHPTLSDRLGLLDNIMKSGFERFENQASLATRFNAALSPSTPENKATNPIDKKIKPKPEVKK
ncbi:MAG: M48 family metalloprotease [Pseudomonadota bacterium]